MELVEKTIGCCLKERAECTPNGVCIVCDGKEYLWKQLWSEAEKIRLWLSGQGIRQHDRVALIGKSSFMWISAFYALTGLGAVVVPISHLYKKQEVSVVLKSMEIQHILFDEESGKVLDGLDRREFPCLKSVNIFGFWLRSEAERKIEEPCFKTDNPYDTACILLTSGSTGYPKGVMLSHYSLINNSRGMCEITGWGEEDRICLSVPLFHCFGISAGILASVISGAGIYICAGHETKTVLQTLDKYHCTVFNGVPTMFLAMVYNDRYKKYNISSVNSGIIAGSRISLMEYKKIKDKLGIGRLHISYGQTESSPCITMASGLNSDSDSAGLPLDFVQIRIWNVDENREAETGETGMIQTRGYHVMQGYYGCPVETARTINGDGWLNTGDLGYLDTSGELHVIGRIKEMIIRGGENIAPAEIEDCIRQMKETADVKVFGVPSPVLQEEIAAVIVLNKNCVMTEDDIREWVKEKLADYKIPKYIRFISEMPVLPSGKADVKQLRDFMTA